MKDDAKNPLLVINQGKVEGQNHPNSKNYLTQANILESTLEEYTRPNHLTLSSHSQSINSVSISPNSLQVASGSLDSSIILWDLLTFSPITSLKGHKDEVWVVKFDSTGETLVSGSKDSSIIVWDALQFIPISTFSGHTQGVLCLCFILSSPYLVSGSEDCALKVWNLELKKIEFSLFGHSSSVRTASAAQNGSLFISGSAENIKVWDFTDKTEVFCIESSYGEICSVVLARRDEEIVAATDQGYLIIWNLQTRSEDFVLKCHSEAIYSLTISNDHKTLVTGSADLAVKFIDLDTRIEKFRIHAQDSINSVDIASNGKFLVLGMANNDLSIRNIENVSEVVTLTASLERLTSIVLTSDSEYLISASADSRIKIWDLNTMQEDCTLTGHSEAVSKVLVSEDGKWVYSASFDGLIKVWNFEERNEEKTLEDDIDSLFDLALSSSNHLIASLGQGEVSVWSLASFMKVLRIQDDFDSQSKLKFSVDSQMIFITINSIIQARSPSHGGLLYIIEGHSSIISCLTVTPDDNFLISADYEAQVKFFNLKLRKEEFSLTGHESQVLASEASKDCKFLFTSSEDGSIRVWNLLQQKEEIKFPLASSNVFDLKFSESRQQIIAATDTGLIIFFDLKDKSEDLTLAHGTSMILALDLSADGKFCVSASEEGKVKLWDLEEMTEDYCFDDHASAVCKVLFSPDSKHIISSGCDHLVKVWNVEERSEVLSINCGDTVGHAMFSPDSLRVAFSYQKSQIKLIDFKSQAEIISLNPKTEVFSFGFTRDCRHLLSSGKTFEILFWNLESGRVDCQLAGHRSALYSITVSPDGRTCCTSGRDKFIKVWSLVHRREIFTFAGSAGFVYSLRYSPDSSYVASANNQGLVQIWNLIERRCENSLKPCRTEVSSAVFTIDGSSLFTAGNDSLVKIWKLREKPQKSGGFQWKSGNDFYQLGFTRYGTVKVNYSNKELKDLEVKFEDFNEKSLKVSFKNEVQDFQNAKSFIFQPAIQELRKIGGKQGLRKVLKACEVNKIILSPASIRDPFLTPKRVFLNFLSCMSSKNFSNLDKENLLYSFSAFLYTLVHVWAFLGFADLLKTHVLNNTSLSLRADLFGRSPVFYSIHSKHQDCTDLLLKFLVLLNPESLNFLPSVYSIRKDFLEIIENSSIHLPELLNQIFLPSPRIAAQRLFDLPDYHFSDLAVPCIDDFPKSSSNENASVVLRFLPFQVPSEIFSKGNLKFLESLNRTSNKKVFETKLVRYLIDYNWNQVYHLAVLYSLLIVLNVISFVLAVFYAKTSFVCLLFYFAVSLALLIVEIFQLMTFGAFEYFRDLMNLFDFFMFLFSSYWIVALIFSFDSEYELYCLAFIVMTKGLTAFGLFDGTRHYINLIFSSLLSIRYFLVMFVYSTFFFSVLLVVSNNKQPSFDSLWNDSWALNFGESLQDNPENRNFWLNYLTMFLVSVVNIILMLNMLISILGDCFDRFQIDKNFIDYKEKLGICLEIQQTFVWKRTNDKLRYFQAVSQCFETDEEEWESRISFLEKKNQARSDGLKKDVVECIEGSQKGFQRKIDEVRERVEGVEKNVLTMSHRIGGLEDGLKKVLEILEKKK